MNVAENKNETYTRAELLYDPETLRETHETYGDATEIKRHIKTEAFVYEIRTAIQYWTDGERNHRTCDCTWHRLDAYENRDYGLDEAMRL